MRVRASSALAAALLALAIARPAAAQEASRAEVLFNEANALAAAGKYGEACPKLEESQKLEPAVGTQFNLADCWEHVGRTATAYTLFGDVARIARAAGKFERERLAKERAAALEPRLARLELAIERPAPGQDVLIGGTAIARDRWTTAVPVDPGTLAVKATAPGRTAWEGTALALEGKTVTLAIPELVDPNPPPPPAPPPKPVSSTNKTIALALGGVGLAGVAVGAIAGGMAISSNSRAEELCPADRFAFRCPTTEGTDEWNSATTAGNVSTIGFIVGGVALAGAAVLWLTAPKARPAATARSLFLSGSF